MGYEGNNDENSNNTTTKTNQQHDDSADQKQLEGENDPNMMQQQNQGTNMMGNDQATWYQMNPYVNIDPMTGQPFPYDENQQWRGHNFYTPYIHMNMQHQNMNAPVQNPAFQMMG